MYKKLIRLLSLILIPMFIVSAVLMWYDNYLDHKIDEFYNSDIGSTYGIDELNKGIKLLAHNANKGDLIILGSSELAQDYYLPQSPKYMFPNTQLNCNVSLVGRAYTQGLLDAIKSGALSNEFKDKRVVLITSLQWFMDKEVYPVGYKSNFSELQFYKFMNNKSISDDIKKYTCERTKKLAKNESSLERPYLYADLYQKDNFFSHLALNCLKPYYYIREKFLDVKDKHEAYKIVKQFKDKPVQQPIKIDWDQEFIKAQKMGEETCTNNQFNVFDEYYSKYLEPRLEELKDSYSNTDLLKSDEMEDYKALLETFKQAGVNPYIILTPTNGSYYDYIGLTKEKRLAFYDKLGEMISEYGFDHLDLREKEYEPYFLKDVMHLGWRGWLYVNKQITEHYS